MWDFKWNRQCFIFREACLLVPSCLVLASGLKHTVHQQMCDLWFLVSLLVSIPVCTGWKKCWSTHYLSSEKYWHVNHLIVSVVVSSYLDKAPNNHMQKLFSSVKQKIIYLHLYLDLTNMYTFVNPLKYSGYCMLLASFRIGWVLQDKVRSNAIFFFCQEWFFIAVYEYILYTDRNYMNRKQ